ncbi:universal stress protein [Trinickia sp. EG282A]|uniref:universal stress protein n=1 Tax=Trinickia sp. EG282A TaxID=3237013 RepID=UPI0034D2A2E8
MAYRRIMLAVDGSASSKRATLEATRIAALAQASVLAVHVVDLKSLLASGEAYAQSLKGNREGHIILAEARDVLRSAGIASEEELVETNGTGDDIASCLERCASRCAADLVVMGTHGRRGVKRLMHGSVAARFLTFSTRPVLVVRADSDEEST